jgi:hypothetical protein
VILCSTAAVVLAFTNTIEADKFMDIAVLLGNGPYEKKQQAARHCYIIISHIDMTTA